MTRAQHETVQARQAFFELSARDLVDKAVPGSLPVWSGPRKLSEQFAFYGDDDVLAVIGWPGAAAVTDEALAWGLALGGDRDVVLVLPQAFAAATLQRLPWVSAPVTIWTYTMGDPLEVVPAVVPAQAEVLAEVAGWGHRGTGGREELGDEEAAWVQALVGWLDAQPDLASRHRESYLAWHTGGRQVLKITRSRDQLRIDAGVRYAKPTAAQPAPLPSLRLSAALTSDQLAQVQATIQEAITRRHVGGSDVGHVEHRLQHALQTAFESAGELLGLVDLHREFPAWRLGRCSGFIDFLGRASDGTPHVVETKLDNDLMLTLQGLDYWIWATANPATLTAAIGGPVTGPAVIDFVVGAHKTTRALGPYTLRQLEALDGSIAWRFHVVKDWATTLHIDSLPSRRTPEPPTAWKPLTPPRFADRLQGHLLETHRPALLGDGPFFRSPQSGLVAEAWPAWHDLEERDLLHRYANHVRSSQVFALNLFAGLDHPARIAIAELAGIADVATTSEVVFEFEDTADRLGEATHASPHRTQVDVMIACATHTGARTTLLIEVKLSELDFSQCSAYQATRNDSRDVCRADGPFGNDPAGCFQLRNHDRAPRRTYDLHLGPTSPTHNGCAFRLGVNQPMRNVAVGRALMAAGETDEVVHALAAPYGNRAIWRRWGEAKTALDHIPGVRLADIPAEMLLSVHEHPRAAELARRYELVPTDNG